MSNLLGTDLFGEPVVQSGLGPLAERFLMPPFSVLSAIHKEPQAGKNTSKYFGFC